MLCVVESKSREEDMIRYDMDFPGKTGSARDSVASFLSKSCQYSMMGFGDWGLAGQSVTHCHRDRSLLRSRTGVVLLGGYSGSGGKHVTNQVAP